MQNKAALLKILEHNASCILKELSQLTLEISELQLEILKDDGKCGELEIGYQYCTSPIGHCVYHDSEYDECIYCGLPEERK